MASYQDLASAKSNARSVSNKQSDSNAAQSALVTMKIDMDAAIKNKQQINSNTGLSSKKTSSVQSNELIAALVNEAGDRILDESQVSRVIEMAWEDRTPFEAIELIYGLDEAGVIKLMRQELKPSSFRLWRQRVSNRATKHQAKRGFEVGRAYCKTQYKPR